MSCQWWGFFILLKIVTARPNFFNLPYIVCINKIEREVSMSYYYCEHCKDYKRNIMIVIKRVESVMTNMMDIMKNVMKN